MASIEWEPRHEAQSCSLEIACNYSEVRYTNCTQVLKQLLQRKTLWFGRARLFQRSFGPTRRQRKPVLKPPHLMARVVSCSDGHRP